MAGIRKPFQGVANIIRFNWHFYVIATMLLFAILLLSSYVGSPYRYWFYFFSSIAVAVTMVSLIISYYVYDLSDLYQLTWLNEIAIPAHGAVVNINAGFDETSTLLKEKFPDSELSALDFYDPSKNTEVSIKRAREAYHTYPGTQQVSISSLPMTDDSIDTIFVILAAHEIRSEQERNIFFAELKRILNPSGRIILVEHLRDFANFAAYNVGFFHFIPRASWLRSFDANGLNISQEVSITPFITTFVLRKDGNTA